MRSQADAMVSSGMAEAGYTHVNIGARVEKPFRMLRSHVLQRRKASHW
eukprot:SAG31_NODE_11524_length_1021_cov_1.351410_2_plen_48_part_00